MGEIESLCVRVRNQLQLKLLLTVAEARVELKNKINWGSLPFALVVLKPFKSPPPVSTDKDRSEPPE